MTKVTIPELDVPLNITEKYFYAIAVRLDRVIELLEEQAEETTTISTVTVPVNKPAPRKRTTTKKEG